MVTFFTMLFFRYRAGIVTKDMLCIPKRPFAAMGALEALGLASGMAAAGECCDQPTLGRPWPLGHLCIAAHKSIVCDLRLICMLACTVH